MLYILWIVAWTVSQRLMMSAGIIYQTSLLSTILTALVSVIAILIVRESRVLFLVTCIVYVIMFVVELERGRVENAIVEVIMDAILVVIALKPWKKQTGGA